MSDTAMQKTKHIWPSLVLGVASIVSISLASAVFSQGGYPPPTDLIAETQAIGSGQIKLKWQKPTSSEVIGYNIYRNNSYLDYVIGANTLSYYDSNLRPSTAYDYFLKAVYLGVSEENLPASNVVLAVSPPYCTSDCVGLNPFIAGPGRVVVDFKGKKIGESRKQSETFSVSLPAGRYQVYAHSFDAYKERKNGIQDNERWFVSLMSNGKEISKTNLTPELEDGKAEVAMTAVIETELTLTEPVNQIKAMHGAFVNGGEFGSVGVSAVMFVDMNQSNPECLLVIDKTADKEVVAPGELITYTITARNDGGANCTGTGTYIYDFLPPQVTYVSETHTNNMHVPGPNAYYSDGHYVWLAATTPLTPGEVATAVITVQVKVEDEVQLSCEKEGIVNQAYATNSEYSNRLILVYSNPLVIKCEPEPAPEINETITPAPNPADTDEAATWTATPFGECPGPFSYSWTGDDGLTGSTRSITHAYANPGSYYATVTVSAPGCLPITKQSAVPLVVKSREPITLSCSPTPQVAQIGRSVTWEASVTPPNPPGGGNYSFSWSGDENLSGNSQSVTKTYATSGVKTARVFLTNVANSPVCSGTVRVQDNPNYQEI